VPIKERRPKEFANKPAKSTWVYEGGLALKDRLEAPSGA
jgi:hypothetical protein